MLRSITRCLPVGLAGVTLLVLVACGGAATTSGAAQGGGNAATAAPDDAATDAPNDGQSGGDGSFDLCDTLTLDEVSAAAGVEVVDMTSANNSGIYSCNYNTADGTPVAGSTLTTPEAAIDPGQMFDANVGAEGAADVPGVGDRAVITGADSFPILFAQKGDSLLAMSVLADNLDAAGKRQATIDLARLAAERLP